MYSQRSISFPALGFGTSRLGHHPTKSNALHSLNVAYDHGIVYFDTAPIYGYGWSEKLLGAFIQDKRDRIQIATKIGLQPSKILSALPFGLIGSIRKLARTLINQKGQHIPVGVNRQKVIAFDSNGTMKSLEESLQRLRTDYIDVLLLHEATVEEANMQETIQFMDHILSLGMVRAVGVGSTMDKLNSIGQLDPIYTIVQHEFDLSSRLSRVTDDRIVNTHGLFQNIKRMTSLSNNSLFQKEISKAANLELSTESDIMNFCLAGAKYEYANGITLFSSIQEKHIRDTIFAWTNTHISKQQFHESIAIIRKYTQEA